MFANDASALFFQVIGGNAGTLFLPCCQARGRLGSIASAVPMPTMATPLSITCSATGRRRMPPVTISGMRATLCTSRANSRK
ncbi:hypothetical protein D9M71_327230 [compost metagenome]